MLELLGLSLLIMSASLAGKLFVWRGGGSYIERNLDYLVSFSAGVFLIFLYGLMQEALEHAGSAFNGVAWIVAGALGIWLLFKFLPISHVHDHSGHSHAPLDARRLLVADSLHNMADGIFLAAAYLANPALALVAGISIFVHEVLQEISEFFVLRDAGYSVRKALTLNFATSAGILVGSIGGYFLLDVFEILEAPLLGLAAGGLLVVVLHDLIPHSLHESRSAAHYIKHVLWFVAGLAAMALVIFALPHIEI